MNYFKSHLSAFFFFAVASILLVSCEDDSKLPPTNYCGDNIMNHGETGVDCGGPCWPCEATCSDGIQNGTETGVDCGGICTPCPVTSTCTDGVMNGDETGVDCGGPDCPACPDPTCTDGVMNGDETGVDCGGPDCPACVDPTCTDGIMNGDETGVDCGGPDCPACPPAGEYMTADLNGAAFTANVVLGEIINSGATISVQSDNSQDDQMSFQVPIDVTAGTYDLVGASGYSVTFLNVSDGTYTPQSGTITITNHDTSTTPATLTGTFEFTAVIFDVDGTTVLNTAVITNGAFHAEYQ